MFLHHHLPPKLNSCRPPLQYPLVTLSLNHLFLHVLMLLPRIWSPLESSSIIPTSYHSPLFHHPDSNTVQDAKKLAKHDRGKEKKNY
ncbi:hypothetical protein TNCV_2496811 [Trichonephila clavipes]|nr:hypothetical protein TNCV_2496811 [Trichonephila clavipes]